MVRIVLILLLGCATDYNQINKPIDTKEAIKDLQSIEVSSIKDSSIRERVVRVLQDCGEYGKDAYSQYNKCQESFIALQSQIVGLEKQLAELEEEIKPYRYFKRFLLLVIIAILIFYGIKLYLKFKPI